jgi:hypothetical protein
MTAEELLELIREVHTWDSEKILRVFGEGDYSYLVKYGADSFAKKVKDERGLTVDDLRVGDIITCGNTRYVVLAVENDIEYDLGACVISRVNDVCKSAEMYYMCKSTGWTKLTALEYDTYGWEVGTEGEVKAGNVNTSIYYIYKNGIWQTATNVEADLNGCTYSREGEVGKSGNTYYICKSKNCKRAALANFFPAVPNSFLICSGSSAISFKTG